MTVKKVNPNNRFMAEKLQGEDVYQEPLSASSDIEMLERKLRFSSQVINDLSFWKPHPAQALIGRAIFIDGKTDVIVECGRKFGKCLNLLEFLETPSGLKQLKDIEVGDLVFGSNGSPCSVTFVSDIYSENNCYEVLFSDGTSTIADADHKWIICNWEYKRLVKTTEEILSKLKWTTRIPLSAPVIYQERELKIKPYTLGVWLGDGDQETVDGIALDGYDLLKNKHIPDDYIYNSIENRLELIRGLFDTDGWVSVDNGKCYFAQKNESIFFSTVRILRSLGMSVTVTADKIVDGKLYKTLYTPANLQIFNLKIKADRLTPHLNKKKRSFKRITSIKKVDKVPVKCIGVDSQDNSYLIKDYTVTHNSELGPYCQTRWAILNAKSFNYYFVPIKDQIGDIIWANGRLPDFLPLHLKRKYLDGEPSKSEYRINFKNGSFIRCDGSDSFNKARGYTANGLQVYDETKDFHPMFHNAFDPNRATNNSPLLAMGTPGDEKALLTQLFDAAELTKYGAAFNFSSHANPHISHDFLEKKRAEYVARGDLDVYDVEYGAKRVRIGKKYIFPMLNRKMVKPHEELLTYVHKYRKDFDFYAMYDPGSAKCFGVLFVAVHRYNKHVIILDEIYEKHMGENTTKKIVPRAIAICEEINKNADDWMHGYDYAAAWFYSGIMDEFPDYGYSMSLCVKDLKDKENKLSLIKDIMIGTAEGSLLTVSDKAVNFYKEAEEYKLDDKGNLKKINDHLLDCLRYILNLAGYYTIEDARPIDFKIKYEKGTFEQDEIRRNPEEGYGSFDIGNAD